MICLPRAFYERTAREVARALLGCSLVRTTKEGPSVGRIVETEAYFREDPASHSYKGETARNATMFGPSGRAYVFSIRQYVFFNVVTAPPGSGVLIRALEPLEGIDLMEKRRGSKDHLALTTGPGKLCMALDITKAQDGYDLTRGGTLWIAEPAMGQEIHEEDIVETTRIGITEGKDALLRFCVKDSLYLSRNLQGRAP